MSRRANIGSNYDWQGNYNSPRLLGNSYFTGQSNNPLYSNFSASSPYTPQAAGVGMGNNLNYPASGSSAYNFGAVNKTPNPDNNASNTASMGAAAQTTDGLSTEDGMDAIDTAASGVGKMEGTAGIVGQAISGATMLVGDAMDISGRVNDNPADQFSGSEYKYAYGENAGDFLTKENPYKGAGWNIGKDALKYGGTALAVTGNPIIGAIAGGVGGLVGATKAFFGAKNRDAFAEEQRAKKRDHRNAMNIYYDEQAQKRAQIGADRANARRGAGIPNYGSGIYNYLS